MFNRAKSKGLETINIQPTLFTFVSHEDWVFERIMYIRNTLNRPGMYIWLPNGEDLLEELVELCGIYCDLISKKVKEDWYFMSKIIVNLSKEDMGNLLLGGEIELSTSTQQYDNLQSVVIKCDDYSCSGYVESVDEDW